MSTTRRDNRVYRAEFRDWIKPSTIHSRMFKGSYVIEVARWGEGLNRWAAMIDGDRCKVVLSRPTAAAAKRDTRRFFHSPISDWVVGEKVNGQWKPADEARENELRRGA